MVKFFYSIEEIIPRPTCGGGQVGVCLEVSDYLVHVLTLVYRVTYTVRPADITSLHIGFQVKHFLNVLKEKLRTKLVILEN